MARHETQRPGALARDDEAAPPGTCRPRAARSGCLRRAAFLPHLRGERVGNGFDCLDGLAVAGGGENASADVHEVAHLLAVPLDDLAVRSVGDERVSRRAELHRSRNRVDVGRVVEPHTYLPDGRLGVAVAVLDGRALDVGAQRLLPSAVRGDALVQLDLRRGVQRRGGNGPRERRRRRLARMRLVDGLGLVVRVPPRFPPARPDPCQVGRAN